MIDQAARDAYSQLLVVYYLRWRGVRVYVCSKSTLRAMCERYRPHVVFASWLGGGAIMSYLQQIQHKTRIVLVDQEGGRLGEEPFKRSFTRLNGAKADFAKMCAIVFTWGTAQAQWLRELGILSEDRIVVTGSPRFDPYLIQENASHTKHKYVGVTLRGDAVTSLPMKFVEHIFSYVDARDGISVGYPVQAQHEDRIWHVVAGTRYMFKVIIELSHHTDTRIVIRPGPWEQYGMYHFLTRHIPQVSIEPNRSQPDYVNNAFAILDESSSLGLEALLVNTPVISTQALIPRLEEHIGGDGGALFHAPYTRTYWRPRTVEEAVEYVLKAEKGEMAATPCPDVLRAYLENYHGWPRPRPSSFQMGDAILQLLGLPEDSHLPPCGITEESDFERFKRTVYQYLPGSVGLAKSKLFCKCLFSRDREHLKKYIYFDWFYPHHREVSKTFASLLRLYDTDCLEQ